jgi:hypothetical protein
VADGGSGDFLEQEGEVGCERRPSIWREAHGSVLTADGGNNGSDGFNSGEKQWAPAVQGGQAATEGRQGGCGVLARLSFTHSGDSMLK